METDIVIFWFVVLSCISGLAVTIIRIRPVATSWIVLYLAILLVSVIGQLWGKSGFIYAGLAMWLLLVLTPSLLGQFYSRYSLQQKWAAAERAARVLGWLHPFGASRQALGLTQALRLVQAGDLTTATEILRRSQQADSPVGLTAAANLYKIMGQWEELLAWEEQNSEKLHRQAQLLSVLLRARGETGDLSGMVKLYERNKGRISKLVPASSRDICRLMLFAFCGQPAAVERLMTGSLSMLPASAQEFWRATAEQASGRSDSAKQRLEGSRPAADPAQRQAIERRLSRISILPQPLDASALRVVEEAAREQDHDEKFGASRSLFSKQARGTQILITLNILMFLMEMFFGSTSDGQTLYQLGALYPPAVQAGEWWRLFASLFLHFGPIHLAMNMLALWVLGPFTEHALGFGRFMLVYLVAGAGSMGLVMMFSSAAGDGQVTVGASGCIMGLVGATGALMLRGWQQEKASSAKRRLLGMILIIAMQSVFDSMVPQVSMTAHLSGALIGFAVTIVLRDRLSIATHRQSARGTSQAGAS